ncbi:MAG: hypothetical protein AB7F61_18705 [Desulfobulbus sp.]
MFEESFFTFTRSKTVDPDKKKLTSVALPEHLLDRIDNYLNLSFTAVKSKRELFERAVTDFLDQEEILSAKMEREWLRIKETRKKR